MRTLKLEKGSRRWIAAHASILREPSSIMSRAQVSQVLAAGEENRQSVCFTGHRHMLATDIPAVRERLHTLLEQCYERGYRDFLCGGALGFDTLAAEQVVALRRTHDDVRLVLVIPCGDQSRYWSERDAMRYERLLYAADDIRVLAPSYYAGCMHVRNRYLVDHSSLCICYLRHQKGGTASTVAYALKQKLPVLNVALANGAAFADDPSAF